MLLCKLECFNQLQKTRVISQTTLLISAADIPGRKCKNCSGDRLHNKIGQPGESITFLPLSSATVSSHLKEKGCSLWLSIVLDNGKRLLFVTSCHSLLRPCWMGSEGSPLSLIVFEKYFKSLFVRLATFLNKKIMHGSSHADYLILFIYSVYFCIRRCFHLVKIKLMARFWKTNYSLLRASSLI